MEKYDSVLKSQLINTAAKQSIVIPGDPSIDLLTQRISPKQLVHYFINHQRMTISPNSFRLYRIAIKTGLNKFYSAHHETKESLQLLMECKAISKDQIVATHGKRTSQERAKGLSSEILEDLKEVAKSKRMKAAPKALAFLNGSKITGLRPREWIYASIIHIEKLDNPGVQFGIKTKTIKTGAGDQASVNQRLPFRTIPVPFYGKLTEAQLSSLRWCISFCEQIRQKAREYIVGQVPVDKEEILSQEVAMTIWITEAEKMQRTLRNLDKARLYEVKGTPNERVTWYSARHQFKSDCKAVLEELKYDNEEAKYLISALMGHHNPNTQDGYGSSSNERPEGIETVYTIDQLSDQARYLAEIISNT